MDRKPNDRGTGIPMLDVVIVNWNSGDLLRDCIAALDQSTIAENLTVFVADNHSADDSLERLTAARLTLDVLRSPENLGFGRACNLAAARGRAPFILILNPDTRVPPETLARALDYLTRPENLSVGVLGVRLVDDEGTTHRTCARAPTLGRLLAQAAGLERVLRPVVRSHFMTEWDHQDTRPVDQVMGAFLMIRRELFERLGGFDERFFVYYEDVDLCRRARVAGAAVMHLADAEAWHLGGGTTNQVRDRRLFYMLRSQAHYAAKYYGRWAALAVLAAAIGLNVPIRAARALLSWSPRDAGQALRGGLLLIRDMPNLIAQLAAEARPRHREA